MLRVKKKKRLKDFKALSHGAFMCGVLLAFSVNSRAQTPALAANLQTITVQPGESVRDLAQKYYDDANLWEEILKSNNLKSPAEVKAGMQLTLASSIVQVANRRLDDALQKIQKATEAGAKVFAPDSIGHSITMYDEAVVSRKNGDWKKSIELAQFATIKAESALRETMAKRNVTGLAELSDRKGNVESRKPVEAVWANAPLLAKLIEGEMVRTLSSSFAEISFHDESRIRLNENSQAVIQRMRVDLLEKKRQSSVSLVAGNAFAFLQGNQKRKTFDVVVPGVSTKVNSKSFWVQKDDKTTRFANYEGEIEVTSQGATVVLAENQGSLVESNKTPTKPTALLPSPMLLTPESNQRIFGDQLTFKWSAIDGAKNYWLEVSREESFRKVVLSANNLTGTVYTPTLDDGGIFYWRVAAMDANGLPSRFSDAGFFNIVRDAKAPFLQLDSPEDQALVRDNSIIVSGKTEKEVSVTVNGAKVEISPDETFELTQKLKDGVNEIIIEAKDAAGNTSNIRRTITYVADSRVEISYDPALKQIAPKHFIFASSNFALSGKTRARSAISLQRLSSKQAMRTFADKEGSFQIALTAFTSKEKFILTAQTPAGYTAHDTLSVEIDDTPPHIIFDAELPSITSRASFRLQGTASGAASLTVNGKSISLRNEKFDETVSLQPGMNSLRFAAVDFAGNASTLEKQILLDNEAPKLLAHKLTPRVTADGRVVHVVVSAQDQSALKRSAQFTVQAGSFVYTGYLIFNQATQAYEELVKIPKDAPATITLKSVVLEDYYGNRKDYQL